MPKPSLLFVVEDDTHIRKIVCQILEDEGYRVIVARNGKEALTALLTNKPNLILLDLQMPVMTGWTFMEELQKTDVSAPVLIMSAQINSIEQAHELGAVDCLGKPFELDDLLAKVAKYTNTAVP